MHEIVMTGQQVAGEYANLRAQLETLISSVDKSTLDIAEILYKVKANGSYTHHFATFKEFTDSLKLKPRKAQYLTRIVECFDACGIQRAQYEPLGTAKQREISSLDYMGTWTNPVTNVTTPIKEFIAEFVKTGADTSLDDIKEQVRTLKGFNGANDIVWRNFPFTRADAEAAIDPAIALAQANIGSVGKDSEGISIDATPSACVVVWAVEYLNDPNHNPLNQVAEPAEYQEPEEKNDPEE